MNGKISTVKKHTYEAPQLEKAKRTEESEVVPRLPTSGQVLGTIVKTLGINNRKLSSKTARRFFSGRLKSRVKESSRKEIITAIADALADVGSDTTSPYVNAPSPTFPPLADVIDWHARNWDQLRTILRPRMPKVFPSHLAAVWKTYIRLVAIDLALRVAAYIRLAGDSPAALDFLHWIGVERRGAYLNKIRGESGRSVLNFAEAIDVSTNAVEAWLYQGARPSNVNLVRIAKALAPEGKNAEGKRLLRVLSRLYWTSDLVELLAKYTGAEAVADVVKRLRQYATLAHRIIDDGTIGQVDQTDLVELATLGHRSPLAQPLLAALHSSETDDEWRSDLQVKGTDLAWVRRLVSVNREVHRTEVNDLIEETDGQLLKNWDVSNPEAYAHYERSAELQLQGRIDEAMAEVAMSIQLDPLDPANHCTMGSFKGGIGIRVGDAALVKEGLDACWMAVTLDPNWILPWSEIGWVLLGSGRPEEAVEHLQNVKPECGPLDANYYTVLGMALMQLERYAESLAAFESSLDLNPDDPRVAEFAAAVASQSGDPRKAHRYTKDARHLGASEGLEWRMEVLKALRSDSPSTVAIEDHDQQITALSNIILRDPGNAAAYFKRARAYFAKGEDSEAILDLNAVTGLDPEFAAAYLFRGMVYGYMEHFDCVVSDMTKFILLSPGEAIAHYHRGMAYGEQDNFDLAISDFDETVRLEPKHVDAFRARGDSYLYKGEYERAISDFNTALELDPKHATSYRGRGAAYRMKLEFDKAITDYDAALRFAPDDQFAYRFRGDAYAAIRDYEKALADFNVALSMNPSDEVAYRGRGNVYLFTGNFELALTEYNAALECAPNSAPSIHGRGLARHCLGDAEGAAEDYRRARELGYDDA